MKKNSFHPAWYFVVVGIIVLIVAYNKLHKRMYISPISYIVKEGQPSSDLQQLLKLSYIEYDGTFDGAVQATQKYWVRPPQMHRWKMDNPTYANRKEIWDTFDALHLVQQVEPLYKKYTHLVLRGDTYEITKLKLNFMISYFNQGVRCKHIIFLVSERPLAYDSEIDYMMHDYGISSDQCPKTEASMVEFVYNHMHLPESMRACKPEFIKVAGADKESLPSPQESVKAWLATNPVKGTCLLLSAQPYIAYECSVFSSYLPANLKLESVGPSTSEFIHPGLYFEVLAKILLQEKIRMNMKKAAQ